MDDIKIIFCGDTFLKTHGSDNEDPFEKIKTEFNDYDVISINLETVVSDKIELSQSVIKHISLCENTEKLKYIKRLGDKKSSKIVSVAQNHILDYGLDAARDSLKNLSNFGIDYVGADGNTSRVIDVKGKKIAFIAGYNRYQIFEKDSFFISDERDVLKEILRLKKLVDIVCVSMHWGTEHVLYANPEQQKWARRFVDSGADLIIGHHPHCIQGHELYKGKHIYYSLGNFNFWGFDRPMRDKNRKCLMVCCSISASGEINAVEIPIFINRFYKPEKDVSGEAVHKLQEISGFLLPKVPVIEFYRRCATTYLRGNIQSRVVIIKKDPKKLIQFIIWLFAKPFNWGCYWGLILNFFGESRSRYNNWSN